MGRGWCRGGGICREGAVLGGPLGEGASASRCDYETGKIHLNNAFISPNIQGCRAPCDEPGGLVGEAGPGGP